MPCHNLRYREPDTTDRLRDQRRLAALDGHHELNHEDADHTLCITCWWHGPADATHCPYDGLSVDPDQRMTMTTQQSADVAIRFVHTYSDDITSLLPSHVTPSQWLGVVTGALRKPEIAQAAANNLGAFANALLTASRLGLEPGSEQFYLVPQSPKKGAPREILGITGYQGLIELIYRAGAVASVTAEVVHENDEFVWMPGSVDTATPRRWEGPQAQPFHQVDWFGDRGAIRGVYAYAAMKDGATSKVVVLGKADIARIKQSSASASSDYSPWNRHESAMLRKSAIRQLAKWVPTSGEFRREQLRAVQDVMAEREAATGTVLTFPSDESVDPVTGEVLEGELVDPHTAAAAQTEIGAEA